MLEGLNSRDFRSFRRGEQKGRSAWLRPSVFQDPGLAGGDDDGLALVPGRETPMLINR